MNALSLYLTQPNFSKHPLNYLSLLFVFFVSFSLSSNSHASHYDFGPTNLFPDQASATAACAQYQAQYCDLKKNTSYPYSGGGIPFSQYFYVLGKLGSEQFKYAWPVDPTEYVKPCNAGEALNITQEVTAPHNSDNPPPIEIKWGTEGDTVSVFHDGCTFSRPASSESSCEYFTAKDEAFDVSGLYSTCGYTNAGNDVAQAPDGGNTWGEGDPDIPVPDEDDDATEKTKDVTIIEEEITDENGNTTKITTTITTETRDDGTTVTTEEGKTVVEYSKGITKTTTKTVTTTTKPDGTWEVKTDQTTAYVQDKKDIFIIDEKDGVTTITVQGGATGGSTWTTTEGFDANGNSTGLTSTESETGDEELNQAGACEEDPFSAKCVGEFKETAKGQFADGLTQLAAAKAEYQTLIDSIQSDVSNSFDLNINDGGSIKSYDVNIRGVSADIGITKWIPYFDDFDLGALIMAFAALASFFLLMGAARNG